MSKKKKSVLAKKRRAVKRGSRKASSGRKVVGTRTSSRRGSQKRTVAPGRRKVFRGVQKKNPRKRPKSYFQRRSRKPETVPWGKHSGYRVERVVYKATKGLKQDASPEFIADFIIEKSLEASKSLRHDSSVDSIQFVLKARYKAERENKNGETVMRWVESNIYYYGSTAEDAAEFFANHPLFKDKVSGKFTQYGDLKGQGSETQSNVKIIGFQYGLLKKPT